MDLICDHSAEPGNHGPSGPSPLPQHTRLHEPLVEGLGVHHSARQNVTQGAGEPAVPRLPAAGDVLLPSVTHQPGRDTRPAAAHPDSALQARVFKESRFSGQLHRARLVPPSPRSPAGGAAGKPVQTAGTRLSLVLLG